MIFGMMTENSNMGKNSIMLYGYRNLYSPHKNRKHCKRFGNKI